MVSLEDRLTRVHREAMHARILTETQAAVMMLATAILAFVLVSLFSSNLAMAQKVLFVLTPTILVGLMLLLAHRLGLAYEIIRRLDDPDA